MMKVPENTLLVIDSILITAAVQPYVYKVIRETDKTVELIALNEAGEAINANNPRTIRKTSIVAVIETLADFEPYREMNEQIASMYDAYMKARNLGEVKVKKIKREFQENLKKN